MKPNAIISGAGWLTHFASKVLKELKSMGWSDDQIHALVKDESEELISRGAKAFADAIAFNGPIITITGDEEVSFPDWVKKVKKDTTEPTGTLKLEFPRLLNEDESFISSEEMLSRAESRRANLGLRHAQAFLEKYETESFGLPTGTWIPFPGTIVVDRDGGRRVPCLCWRGVRWILDWDWLGNQWNSGDRLVRSREET